MSEGQFTTFTNCRYCLDGTIIDDHLVISEETGTILERGPYIGGDIVDLDDAIIAPGFLELHTNGLNGFHFTNFENSEQYVQKLSETAQYFVSQGVTGFWATLPAVAADEYQKILPNLAARSFINGADLLGAHVEGPYLASANEGAENKNLFAPANLEPSTVYGVSSIPSIVKLMTVAPELSGSFSLIQQVHGQGVKVSLGHSNGTFSQGKDGLRAGATCLTHPLYSTAAIQPREPGLAGLVSLPCNSMLTAPYYSIIADGHHLHPATAALLYKANPSKAIVVTNSIELSGLPDGVYPGHSQIPHPQRKDGALATIEGTNTLTGGCTSLQKCMQNIMYWTGCNVAEAVQTVTENIAKMMNIDGEGGRGLLIPNRRADLVILNDEGEVLQTWIAGKKVWETDHL